MGLLFTLLYIFASYVGPTVVYGPLAEYRMELITVVLAIVFSIPKLKGSLLGQVHQTWALLALTVAVMFSFWSHGFIGLSVGGIVDFSTQALIFPLVLVNCRKRWHMEAVIVVIALACAVTIVIGVTALFTGNLPSPYILVQSYGRADAAYRLQGLGPISDPNDFGQLLAFTMPALFLMWRKGKVVLNFVRVILPASFLFFGLFETHSRGAMMALLVVLIVTFRRKIGLVPSLVLAGLGFVAATAAGWAGGAGREVSVEGGADRLEAWSVGLQLIKSNPIFGVGYKRFAEFYIVTAHNTVVVCAAELGIVGLFCWVVFTLATMRDFVVMSGVGKQKKVRELSERETEAEGRAQAVLSGGQAGAAFAMAGAPAGLRMREQGHARRGAGAGRWEHEAETGRGDEPVADASWAPIGAAADATEAGLPTAEIARMATVLISAMSGYLAAGWFLSRAYVMALFMMGAMSQSIYRMGLQAGVAPPWMTWSKLLRVSLLTSIGLLLVVYVGLIVQHLGPH